ncbi:MAG: acyl carrier protein [Cyclobacteriaceae bacterium]
MNDIELNAFFKKALKNIAPDTDPDKLQPDDLIRRTLTLDSFDFLQFIIKVSETLNISIPEEDYSKISTLKLLTAYIKNKSGRTG